MHAGTRLIRVDPKVMNSGDTVIEFTQMKISLLDPAVKILKQKRVKVKVVFRMGFDTRAAGSRVIRYRFDFPVFNIFVLHCYYIIIMIISTCILMYLIYFFILLYYYCWNRMLLPLQVEEWIRLTYINFAYISLSIYLSCSTCLISFVC